MTEQLIPMPHIGEVLLEEFLEPLKSNIIPFNRNNDNISACS